MSQAYQQLPSVEQSTMYLTINVQGELYQYIGLPFGAASAPAIFQVMDTCRESLTFCYIDDILVNGVGAPSQPCRSDIMDARQ